jgi:hypothetical protein
VGRPPIGKRKMSNAQRQRRYRVKSAALQAKLLRAVDALLKAQGSAQQQAALDKVRVIRNAMLKTKAGKS